MSNSVGGYKFIQNSVAFLYANMNEWNFILKKHILYVSTQKSKNLRKYVQNVKEKKKRN